MGEAGAVSSICVGMTRMRAGLCTLVFLHTMPTLFSSFEPLKVKVVEENVISLTVD